VGGVQQGQVAHTPGYLGSQPLPTALAQWFEMHDSYVLFVGRATYLLKKLFVLFNH
jgi:hypothetical protein